MYDGYAKHRNQPQTDNVSHRSKYLHFGHISPVGVALAVRRAKGRTENEEAYLEERPEERYNPRTVQTSLSRPGERAFPPSKEEFRYQLRIKYRCGDRCSSASSHDQQILEWGVYEWFRKKEGEERRVIENMHLLDDVYEKWFLVGNSLSHPISFMVISVLRFKRKQESPSRKDGVKITRLNSFS